MCIFLRKKVLFLVGCLLFGFSSLTALNNPPTIATIAEQNIIEDSPTTTVPFSIYDHENDTLSISTSISDEALATLELLTTFNISQL